MLHTLNLVACKDVDKFLSSSTASKNVYHNSFAKSSALWNKASRSTVASDTVQEVTKRKLVIPNATRWNSYYNAVVRVSENSLLELNELCTKLELRCFSKREFKFLKEYCAVLKPLTFCKGKITVFWYPLANLRNYYQESGGSLT